MGGVQPSGRQPPLRQTPPSWADIHPTRHPLGRHPPLPSRWPLLQRVRILLECILAPQKVVDEFMNLISKYSGGSNFSSKQSDLPHKLSIKRTAGILYRSYKWSLCPQKPMRTCQISGGSRIFQTGGQPSEFWVKTYCLAKSAWKWKKLDRGGHIPGAPEVCNSPMQTAV